MSTFTVFGHTFPLAALPVVAVICLAVVIVTTVALAWGADR